MSDSYLISLNLKERRAGSQRDLGEIFERWASAHPAARVVKRGFEGRSVTVEMPRHMVAHVRSEFPYVTVELAREMDLLEGTH